MKDNMKILVPVDGSPVSCRAAEFAGGIASEMNGSIDLFFVTSMKNDHDTVEERFIPVEQIVASMQNPNEIFDKAKKGIPAGIAVTSHEKEGVPAQEIAAYAKEEGMDLIVIGSKGHTAVENFLIGSVSQKVLENEGPSVVIVK
ncbi:MAG: universal stress protein [Mitsuokella sp.]